MAKVFANRVKVNTSTTGTGTITLGTSVSGYQTFAEGGVVNTNTVSYVIEDGDNWEIGTGTYTSSGTTLSRTVVESNNSDQAINLSGTAVVFISAVSGDYVPTTGGTMTSDLDMDGNKVLFSNMYSTLNDLPSATDNHGMFAHVHATGKGYFAHGGNWIELANASDVTAYTHPNHSGEVTSTGDGATVIADNVVDEANLKVSNTPTDGYVLTAQSGNTGGLTWAASSGGGGGGSGGGSGITTGKAIAMAMVFG